MKRLPAQEWGAKTIGKGSDCSLSKCFPHLPVTGKATVQVYYIKPRTKICKFPLLWILAEDSCFCPYIRQPFSTTDAASFPSSFDYSPLQVDIVGCMNLHDKVQPYFTDQKATHLVCLFWIMYSAAKIKIFSECAIFIQEMLEQGEMKDKGEFYTQKTGSGTHGASSSWGTKATRPFSNSVWDSLSLCSAMTLHWTPPVLILRQMIYHILYKYTIFVYFFWLSLWDLIVRTLLPPPAEPCQWIPILFWT